MHSWKVMLLATGCQLLVSLLPCAAWPWLSSAGVFESTKSVVLMCLAVVVVAALWCEALATGGRDDVRSQRGQEFRGAQLSSLLVLLVIWCGLLELGFRSSPISWPAAICGLLTATAGISLRSLAIAALGDSFQTKHSLAAPDRLQTTGLYAWVRHPSESGLLLLALGCGMLLQSMVAVSLVVFVLLPLVIVRIRTEEAVLRQICGAAHERYCRRTPLLVPKPFGF